MLGLIIGSVPIPVTFGTADSETDSSYHTYDEMSAKLSRLANEHPDIISLFSIGKSYENRDIWAVKLSDNVMTDEDEPEVLLMGAHHGNERPSYEVLIYFIRWVAESYDRPNTDDDRDGEFGEDPIDGVDNDGDGAIDEDPSQDRVRWVVNNREIYIVPMVNPDGVEAGTRKSREPNYGPLGRPLPDVGVGNPVGVDLNRNYDYMWGIMYPPADTTNPYSNTYQGETAFCEKETQALRDFVNAHEFVLSLSYHTYGGMVLYPWGYTYEDTDDEELFVHVANGIAAIDGYDVMQACDLYLTSGDACDWQYGVKDILAYTIELDAGGHTPDDPALVEAMARTHVGVNLFIAEVAAEPSGEWLIRGEALSADKDVQLGNIGVMLFFMALIFGIVYIGFGKALHLALKAERKKYLETEGEDPPCHLPQGQG